MRNLVDQLPKAEHGWVLAKMRRAWKNPNADEGRADLEALARQLEKINPDAAGSLREGLADMFTITRLGITGALLKTVFSTNPVESMIDIVRVHARNVKRWQDGHMRLRWAAAGMLCAAEQFRKVKGYRQLPLLAEALRFEQPPTPTSPEFLSQPRRRSFMEAVTKFYDERVILDGRGPPTFPSCGP